MMKVARAMPCLAAIVGIATACGQTEGTGLAQLNDDELRLILRGASLTYVPPNHMGILTFGCDGQWSTQGGLALAVGRYSIRENQYCLDGQNGEDLGACFKIFRNEEGTLFGTPIESEITIKKCEPPGTCPQLSQTC